MKSLKFKKHITKGICPICWGSGDFYGSLCPTCKGSGVVKVEFSDKFEGLVPFITTKKR